MKPSPSTPNQTSDRVSSKKNGLASLFLRLQHRWRRAIRADLTPDREKRSVALLKIAVCLLTVLLLTIVGLCAPLRPTTSDVENRTLTKFPKFTVQSFFSGEYFAEIETWYADTYPGREELVSLNHRLEALYGIQTEKISSNGVGEHIPDADLSGDPDYSDGSEGSIIGGNDTNNNPTSPTSPSDPTPSTPTDDPTATDPDAVTDVVTGNANTQYQTGDIARIQNHYLLGDTAYEIYYFNQSNSLQYASLITEAAAQLNGQATVYNMIIPLAYSVQLDKSTQQRIGASDAKAAIDFMYSKMQGVKKIGVLNNLIAHNTEYLYFRSDHHWTARGAYYAYACYCAARGLESQPLTAFKEYAFSGFLGTLYSATEQPTAMKNNPDTVYAYMPNGATTIEITESNGNTVIRPIVNTATDTYYAAAASKYNTFLGGDSPLGYIHNKQLSDGSSVLIVKESFGNAFVPFLVDHYEHTYVLDYRYYSSGTLKDFVQTHNIQDVIFINNLSATGSTARLNNLQQLIQGE